MEVSDQIIKVLDNLCQKFGVAVDWTQSNIMPYVQQLSQRIINYELWTSVAWIIIGMLCTMGLIIGFKKSLINYKNASKYDNFGWWMSCVFCGLGLIISTIVIITQIFDIVTCLTLPEKVWMDYIQLYIQK